MNTSPNFSHNTLPRPRQPIDIKPLKQNLKSPLKTDQFLGKYLPEQQTFNKCLPAKFNTQPIFGELMIKFESIVFLSHVPLSKSKHVIYRCRMMGYSPEDMPLLSNTITYTIHTNNKMFKHYLKDMKVCLVQVLDSRNYQPIGHSYINWLTYMKSTEDNQPMVEKDEKANKYEQNTKPLKKYYLPFLDEECFLTLSLFDYRNMKNMPGSPSKSDEPAGLNLTAKGNPKERIIGKIQLRFMSRIYEVPIAAGYVKSESVQKVGFKTDAVEFQTPDIEHQNKLNVPPSFLEIPLQINCLSNKNMISLKSLIPSSKNQQSQVRYESIESESIDRQPDTLQLRKEQSNHSVFNVDKNSSKRAYPNSYKIDGTGSRLYSHQENQKSYHRSSYERDRNKTSIRNNITKTNQLQLLHLKMDVEEFFKKDADHKPLPKQEKAVIQITKLKSKLQNITQLDVFFNENQEELHSDNKFSLKPHFKIYKTTSDKNKNQDFFHSKLVIERPAQRIIEVHLPNNQGKCIFRCKDLTAINNDICIYNKGIIVGVLTVKKELQNKFIIFPPNPFTKNDNQNTIQHQNPPETSISQKDRICIVVIENFSEHFHKQSDLNQLSSLDNYNISVKSVQFFHEALNNSKNTGEYAITNCKSIPKLFAVEAKSSSNEFVGMSENINFEGNQVLMSDQNIMPTLIMEKTLSIGFKQMPVFKKLPNSVSFRLSMYVANTDQLNYFIKKWKEKLEKIKNLQNRKERSISNTRPVAGRHNEKANAQKMKQRQYTMSDDISEMKNKENERIKTESDNKNSANYKHVESKTSGVREFENERFKTQGNYTEDLHNEMLLGNPRSQIKQNDEQYSQKQENDDEEIYLVQFCCKSLHYVLSRLGSKKIIESKITELNNYHYTNKSVQTEQSNSISQDQSIAEPKGLVSKEQFTRVLSLLIGENNQTAVELLGFDVNQILQALFASEDGNFVKMEEFTLCLMAYYNFILLLLNQKLTALKEVIICEPQVESKLSKIQQSTTNVNSEFLWQDVLSNVIEKTKQSISKRYRIYPNTPFSVNLLLKDLKLAKKNINQPNDETFFQNLINVLNANQQKSFELFMKTTADLGNLVRETVEEIIFTQCLKKSRLNHDKNWIDEALKKIDELTKGEKFDSIESESKNYSQLSLNLTQFQEFFSRIGIETSIWESLMLIEEIKVWYEGDETREKEELESGEGIVAMKLVKSWLNGLKMKIEMRNEVKNRRGEMAIKSSRLNSIKSLDSDEDMIEQMNKRKLVIEAERYQEGKERLNKEHQRQSSSQIFGRDYEGQRGKVRQWEKDLKKQTKELKEKATVKESQTLNNESDIANIANLLRQNQNNLYFLPSVPDFQSLNKITSANNVLSNDKILPALDELSLRNPPYPSPSKFIPESKKQPQIYQLDSDSSQINSSQPSRLQHTKTQTKPVHAYLTIQIKELSLKRKDLVLQREGLKKICLNFKIPLQSNQQPLLINNEPITKHQEHYFLSQQTIAKILSNQKSNQASLGTYNIKNMKVDINSLYEFQTTFSQGFSIELANLTKPQSPSNNAKNHQNYFEKTEEVLFSGVLPIEDIAKQIEDYKFQVSQKSLQKKENGRNHQKKKTIVLYKGRQIMGKAVAQITVSNQQLVISNESVQKEKGKMAKIKFSFRLKQLLGSKQKSLTVNQSERRIMSLSYCSLRDEQNVTELLPIVQENDCHQIELPEPIIEHQLIVRNSQVQCDEGEQNILEGSNLSGISRFTRFDKTSVRHQQVEKGEKRSYECVIPLETLYFRKVLNESYPLIDRESVRFVCSLNVKLQTVSDTELNPGQEQIFEQQKIQQKISKLKSQESQESEESDM